MQKAKERSMDTEKILPCTDFNIDDITLYDYTAEGLNCITSFIEVTRYIEEIHQLFNIFQYNIRKLLSVYELNRNDKIKRHIPQFEDFDDRIELNALVISLISSGKTLVDAVQACIQSCYSKDSNEYNEFCTILSKEYDSCFSYRFLARLRDFSQHGHVPVSWDGETVCFDIGQLVNTPHFNHNKTILGEMEKFCNELLTKEKVEARHVFSLAIAEFTVSLFRVYYEYWKTMEDSFYTSLSNINDLIKMYPETIKHKNKKYDGYLFYQIGNGLHTFNALEISDKMYIQYLEEAKELKETEEKELERFRGRIKYIS